MRLLALAILALSVSGTAIAQQPHGARDVLTPDIAKDVLKTAQEAREQWAGAPAEAARAFRTSFMHKWRPNPCTGRLSRTRETASSVRPCLFGPTSWYAERLASALRGGASLEEVQVYDGHVVVLVPERSRLHAPVEITVSQGRQILNGISYDRVLTTVGQNKAVLESLDAAGNVVLRVVTASPFMSEAFDPTLTVDITWMEDGLKGSAHISSGFFWTNR